MKPKKPPKLQPEQIRAAREKAGLTQHEAAALIGYTYRAWQSWEAGERGMRRALYEMFLERAKPKSD